MTTVRNHREITAMTTVRNHREITVRNHQGNNSDDHSEKPLGR
jgi:hypothetical protein